MRQTSSSIILLPLISWLLATTPALATEEEENAQWEGGFSAPTMDLNFEAVGHFGNGGFVAAPTGCLRGPGPGDTYENRTFVQWDGKTGKLQGSVCMNGAINAISGRGTNVLVGGGFLNVDGAPISYLVRWNAADQVMDKPWAGGPNAAVNAIGVDGSLRVYVGGPFSSVGTTVAAGIAYLDNFTWGALWDEGGGAQGVPGGAVNAIAVDVSHVRVAGAFATAGTETEVGNVATWQPGQPFGAWSKHGGGVDGAVNSIATGTAGIWAAGAINDPTIPALHIAFSNGATWISPGSTALMPTFGVTDVVQNGGGRIFASGDFSNFGDVDARRVGEWSGTTWIGPPGIEDAYPATTAGAQVQLMLPTSEGFYYFDQEPQSSLPVVHGGITHYDGTTFHGLGEGIGEWAEDGLSLADLVEALAIFDGQIVAAGSFQNAGDKAIKAIATFDGEEWNPLGVELNYTGAEPKVHTLAHYQGDLIAGGCFDGAGAVTLNNIGRWTGTSWQALGGGIPGAGSPVSCRGFYPFSAAAGVQDIQNHIGTLYAAGGFTSGFGAPGDNIVSWNGATWSEVGGGTGGVFPTAYALASRGSNLVVGGTFTSVNGTAIPVGRIAEWNGVAWSTLGGGVDNGVVANREGVYALETDGTDVYVGGHFGLAGAVAANNMARWTGSQWQSLGGGLTLASGGAAFVHAIKVVGSDVYVAGLFDRAGGNVARSIARWDGSQWHSVGYGLNYVPILSAGLGEGKSLITHTGTDGIDRLYVSGFFNFAGDVMSNNVGSYLLEPVQIFSDGFESGNTSQWTTP